jgi:hypothetical protein
MDQGSSFYQEINLFDDNDDVLIVNESNNMMLYTAAAQMRKSYQALNAITFDTALSNGTLSLTLSSNATANVPAGRYVYDVEMRGTDNTVTKIIEGIVTVKPEVTKV